MLILQGILYVGSTASLLALCVYIFLALSGDSHPLITISDTRHMTWKGKFYLGLAAIGLFVCMYAGAAAMLFWMPDSWGGIEQETGAFRALKNTLAGTFAIVGGGSLIKIIDQAARNRFNLGLLEEELKCERKVHATTSLARLDQLKTDFEGKVEGLNNQAQRHEEMTEGEKRQRIAYSDLIQLIEKRKLIRLIEMRNGLLHGLLLPTQNRMDSIISLAQAETTAYLRGVSLDEVRENRNTFTLAYEALGEEPPDKEGEALWVEAQEALEAMGKAALEEELEALEAMREEVLEEYLEEEEEEEEERQYQSWLAEWERKLGRRSPL